MVKFCKYLLKFLFKEAEKVKDTSHVGTTKNETSTKIISITFVLLPKTAGVRLPIEKNPKLFTMFPTNVCELLILLNSAIYVHVPNEIAANRKLYFLAISGLSIYGVR